MKIITRTFAVASVLALSAGAALAQDMGPYVEGGYTYLDVQPSGSDNGAETNALTARAGWRITPTFGVEGELSSGIDNGEFDYNVDEDSLNFDDNNDGDLNDVISAAGDIDLNYMVGAYGTARMPITDRIDIHGRAGWAYMDIDATAATPGGLNVSVEDSANGPAIGGGLSVKMTDHWSVRGDYTYYSLDNTDTHAGSVVVGYAF